MRLFIVYLWNYIRVLLYGKLFKKKVRFVESQPSKTSHLTYRSNCVPSYKKRIKNRNNRKRRHKK